MSEFQHFSGGFSEAEIRQAFKGVQTVWDLLPPDDGFLAYLKPDLPQGPTSEAKDAGRQPSQTESQRDSLLGRTALASDEAGELVPV